MLIDKAYLWSEIIIIYDSLVRLKAQNGEFNVASQIMMFLPDILGIVTCIKHVVTDPQRGLL